MTNRIKNAIYSLILLLSILTVYWYRTSQKPKYHENRLQGKTMGVIDYHIRYRALAKQSFQKPIDSLLTTFNSALSTYIEDSEISRFNKSKKGIALKSPFFYPILKKTSYIHQLTQGAFDPTVMPLVNYWGFGPDKKKISKHQSFSDTIMEYVGWNLISYTQDSVFKKHEKVALDFSGIAKGYAVDLIAKFIEDQNVENYLVEIGGELRCRGTNSKGKSWLIGIENPTFNQTDKKSQKPFARKIRLHNQAVATSGSYRNFYMIDGKKYAHTINPKTGYPVTHNLLSVSVFAPDCLTADALSTALMVLGEAKGKTLIDQNPEWKAIFIHD